MDENLEKHILIHSGVTITDYSKGFHKLYKKLSDYFLTPDHKKWFKNRYFESINAISRQDGNCSQMPQILFWELFSFGLSDAYKNNEAVKVFEQLNINKCYLLQLPDYNLCSDVMPAYCLKGKYNVSLIEDADREMLFDLLKKDIKQDVSIPFWVIDNISSTIGKEIYAFDDRMNWVLILTHENEVYLYKKS